MTPSRSAKGFASGGGLVTGRLDCFEKAKWLLTSAKTMAPLQGAPQVGGTQYSAHKRPSPQDDFPRISDDAILARFMCWGHTLLGRRFAIAKQPRYQSVLSNICHLRVIS
jgi:hypothetical protein